jgi:hypothetical protein
VVRALELTGQQVDKAGYRAWFDRAQLARETGGSVAAARSVLNPRPEAAGEEGDGDWSRGRRGGPDRNVAVERIKWLLGLPNNYYEATS